MSDGEPIEALRRSRIAHELRGPAGVALGAAAELARKSEGKEQVFLAMMRRGLERVLRVADRLSRASAIERNLVTFNSSKEDVRPLITQAVNSARELENKSSIEVQLDLGATPVLAVFDHEWLSFCVSEITCNAVQHARKQVRVSLGEDGSRTRVVIEDDGPGFREPPDFSFNAAPNPRRGVGLSLAIVHHVVATGHGGEISVRERDQGGGARVELALSKSAKKEPR